MYIAFKWLLCLTLLMWIGICFVELIHKKSKDIVRQEVLHEIEIYKNRSAPIRTIALIKHKNNNPKYHQANTGLYHFAMFILGALALMITNKGKEIILCTKFKVLEKTCNLDLNTTAKIYGVAAFNTSKNLISKLRVAMNKNLKITWEVILTLALEIKNNILAAGKKLNNYKNPKINLLLLEKLKEVGEQKNNMGHLLLAAIQECKTMRHRLQSEITTKNRLLKCIEESKNLLRDSRHRFTYIQNLHTTAQYEKNDLNARLRQVSREKDDCESVVAMLIHKIYESKNSDLIAFCANIVRPSRGSLLKSSANVEVTNNIRKPGQHNSSGIHIKIAAKEESKVTQIPSRHQHTSETTSFKPIKLPVLKELSGECIWTIKNKDGMLKKVYECGYDSKHDNGDTIRRIREYSVQCDKECQLDYQRLETVVTERIRCRNQNFLTGSEAFKIFLQNNLKSLESPLGGGAIK